MAATMHRTLGVFATVSILLLLTSSGFTQARWTRLAPFPEPDEEADR